MNWITIVTIVAVVAIAVTCVSWFGKPSSSQVGGQLISVRAGPVDMLLQRKQLLMDGYRFQNSMFPPVEYNKEFVSDCNPTDRQRVGIFKAKAYIDQELFNQEQEGGADSPSAAIIAQINGRGAQDVYIMGDKGDPIEDSVNPFGKWVRFSPYPILAKQEINYPNKVFSWGDVIHRYYSDIW
jgi:hypothetical protein